MRPPKKNNNSSKKWKLKDTHTQSHTYEQTDAQVSEANDEEKKNTQTQPKHKTNERKTYVTTYVEEATTTTTRSKKEKQKKKKTTTKKKTIAFFSFISNE